MKALTLICGIACGGFAYPAVQAPLPAAHGQDLASRATATVNQAESVSIEYVAHACFRVTSPSGRRIVVDPYASRVWIGYDFPEHIAADAVLISHPHYDHDAGQSRGHEFPWDREIPVSREPGVYELGDIRVIGVAGKHADPYGKEFGQINTIWLLEVAGLRIVHVGDNGPITDAVQERLGRVDILMLPVDSQYHILKEHEIVDILARLSPRILVPMHYRHPDLEPVPGEPDDLGDIDGWLEGREHVRRLRTHEARFTPGELPAEREIVVFEHWPEVEARREVSGRSG